jgi:hypothetical protein
MKTITPGGKTCSKCRLWKPFSEYSRNAYSPDRRRPDCKSCKAARQAVYYAENREMLIRKVRAYQLEHPDEVRQWKETYAAGRTSEERAAEYAQNRDRWSPGQHRRAVFAHYGQECACCGTTVDLQIDHVNGDGREHREQLGITAGAKTYRWLVLNDFPDGFQTLCRWCNRSKGRGPRCRIAHEAPDGMKRCARCHRVQLLEDFDRKAATSDGHRSECKLCRAELQA